MSIKTVLKKTQKTITKHSPEILTGLGISGMLVSTVLAVKATPKALELINDAKHDYDEENKSFIEYDLSKKDIIKLTWKCYIPSAVTGTVSILCLIGASNINNKRNAALTALYTVSTETLKEYRKNIVSEFGDEKEREINDKVIKKRISKNPVSDIDNIDSINGDDLCYDLISGRYFKSSMNELKRVENIANKNLLRDGYISLNEVYYELGLSSIHIGDELGWNVDDGLIEMRIMPEMSDNDKPCLAIEYVTEPKMNFS